MTDRQRNVGFRTTANKLTRYTADDCKDSGLPTPHRWRNITPGKGDYEGLHCPMNQSGRQDNQSSLFFDSDQGVCDIDGEECHAETCSIFKNTGGAQ